MWTVEGARVPVYGRQRS